MHKFGTLLILVLSGLLTACSVGPDYVRPPADVPLIYKEATVGTWKVASPETVYNRECWWQIFNDPCLNELEVQATESNPNIAVALAKYDQALAIVDEAISQFFPVVSAFVADTESKGSSTITTGSLTAGSSSGSSSSTPVNVKQFAYQATWQIDLWGSVRRLVEEDEATAESDAALLDGVILSTQATLAQTYFQLRALDEAQAAYDESVAAYKKFLKLTKNQYNSGTASQLAVLQAQAQLDAVEVLSIDNGVVRAQLEHAIAVLINKAPSEFSIPRAKTKLVPPPIPVEVPSTILERRPDIASAERLMAAANAQIGVATAAFFPVLNLTGSKQYLRVASTPAIVWAIGAQLTETFFDGGYRAAVLQAADAGYREALATYRQTVLAAFQNVEDNLSTLRILKDEQAAQQKALQAAEKELKFTMNEYKAGTASSLDVLSALYNVYIAKVAVATIASRQMTAAVGLIMSLG
jgi:NodT family efflux transporter outer membrane factor (OMF) lipoprotein